MIVLSNEIQKYFLLQRQLYIFNTKCIYEVFFLFYFIWEGYIWEFNLGT